MSRFEFDPDRVYDAHLSVILDYRDMFNHVDHLINAGKLKDAQIQLSTCRVRLMNKMKDDVRMKHTHDLILQIDSDFDSVTGSYNNVEKAYSLLLELYFELWAECEDRGYWSKESKTIAQKLARDRNARRKLKTEDEIAEEESEDGNVS